MQVDLAAPQATHSRQQAWVAADVEAAQPAASAPAVQSRSALAWPPPALALALHAARHSSPFSERTWQPVPTYAVGVTAHSEPQHSCITLTQSIMAYVCIHGFGPQLGGRSSRQGTHICRLCGAGGTQRGRVCMHGACACGPVCMCMCMCGSRTLQVEGGHSSMAAAGTQHGPPTAHTRSMQACMSRAAMHALQCRAVPFITELNTHAAHMA